MEEIGIVKKITGDQVEIEIDPSNMCGSCASKAVCQIGEGGQKRSLWALNEAGAQIGDLVQVEIEPGKAVFSAFMIFIVPLIFLGIGYFLGSTRSEGWGAVGALFGFLVGLGVIRLADMLLGRKKEFQPFVVRILERCPVSGTGGSDSG